MIRISLEKFGSSGPKSIFSANIFTYLGVFASLWLCSGFGITCQDFPLLGGKPCMAQSLEYPDSSIMGESVKMERSSVDHPTRKSPEPQQERTSTENESVESALKRITPLANAKPLVRNSGPLVVVEHNPMGAIRTVSGTRSVAEDARSRPIFDSESDDNSNKESAATPQPQKRSIALPPKPFPANERNSSNSVASGADDLDLSKRKKSSTTAQPSTRSNDTAPPQTSRSIASPAKVSPSPAPSSVPPAYQHYEDENTSS
ncbi:MAG: hypothetical protein ACRC2T_08265, partial [Thermoguttaceae bacterium]